MEARQRIGPRTAVAGLIALLAAAPALVAEVVETSRGAYEHVVAGAERFKKLPDPEVVVALPALYRPAAGGSIRCELAAERAGEGVRGARARLTVEVLRLDLDAETFVTVATIGRKLKTGGDGLDEAIFDLPRALLPGPIAPGSVAVRAAFALAGGRSVDRVAAVCEMATGEPADEPDAGAPLASAAGEESVSGASAFFAAPAEKLRRLPDPHHLVAVPRTADDRLEIDCDAAGVDRRGEPLGGARWTLLVELFVFDAAAGTFEVTPVGVEAQTADSEGRAAAAFELPTDDFGAALAARTHSAWVQAGLAVGGNQKASQLAAGCRLIRR